MTRSGPTLGRASELRPADVLLADGSIATIRSLAPTDGRGLHRLHQGLSEHSLRLRFFSIGRRTPHKYVDHLLHDRPLALVLEQGGEIVAVAAAEPVDATTVEVSFLVQEGRHGMGAGSLLLEHLAASARQHGVETMLAEVLPENHAMLEVMAAAGFTVHRHRDHDVVLVRLDTETTDTSRSAADARDRYAEARSLHPLLYPRSVAVVGVRRSGRGIGHSVLENIRAGGYTGGLHVVHPHASEIDGVPASPSFADLPEPVDLALVAVPADRVLQAVSDAADAGVPAAVVISSGFEELGERGARLQSELGTLARSRSIRVVGPNCLGVISNDQQIRLNATFTGCVPADGGLAVATQSGGVGIVMADLARQNGLGMGALVSLGNKVDVSGNDLLAAWTDDPRVGAAALYLESFGNARKFARIAGNFALRKPLLAVVGGRSDGGRRAGASHTAAAATPVVGITALFAQAGVIACDGAEDLVEAALLLTREPPVQGPRLGVVSNAGGMGVLAADAATANGLTVPELSQWTRGEISRHVLGTAGTSNPVDAGAAVPAEDLAAIVEVVLTSGEVDAVLVELVATSQSDIRPAVTELAQVRLRHPQLPLLLVVRGTGEQRSSAHGLTEFGSSVAAVRALGRAARYAAWLAGRAAEPAADPPPPRTSTLADLLRHRADALDSLTNDASADGWVGAEVTTRLLSDYGLAPAGQVARGPAGILAVARSIGFPVVLKVADSDVVHRTERGLVRVGLRSAQAVTSAVTSFERELGRSNVPVLVQPLAAGVEMSVGIVRDPSVGPLVMVGAGGVNTDILGDRVYLMPPVRSSDVRHALRGLRCWPLLDGFRGTDRVDVEALVDLVTGCGRLAEEMPLVAEVDLNPVMVTSAGCTLVDVKLRLAQTREPPNDEPRQLRRTT